MSGRGDALAPGKGSRRLLVVLRLPRTPWLRGCARGRGGVPGGRRSLLGRRRVPREACAGWGVRALESSHPHPHAQVSVFAAVEPQASPAGIGVSSDWVTVSAVERGVL